MKIEPLNPALPPLLSIAQASAFLGCSQRTLRRWIDAGDIPAVRIGRLVRIHPNDLDRFIAARRSL